MPGLHRRQSLQLLLQTLILFHHPTTVRHRARCWLASACGCFHAEIRPTYRQNLQLPMFFRRQLHPVPLVDHAEPSLFISAAENVNFILLTSQSNGDRLLAFTIPRAKNSKNGWLTSLKSATFHRRCHPAYSHAAILPGRTSAMEVKCSPRDFPAIHFSKFNLVP